jgi:hypothetical protein
VTERGPNRWSHEQFERILKSTPRISCSFGVATVHSNKTGRWTTVILFHDDDKGAFSHVFELESDSEAYHLAKLLIDSREKVKELIKGE